MSLIQLELELVQESARASKQGQPPQQNVHDALCDIYRSAGQALERSKAPPRKKRRIEQSLEPSVLEDESAYVVKVHSSFVLNQSSSPSSDASDLDLQDCELPVAVFVNQPIYPPKNDYTYFSLSSSTRAPIVRYNFRAVTPQSVKRQLQCASLRFDISQQAEHMVSVKCSLAHMPLPQSQWQLDVEFKWREGSSPVLELANRGNRIDACEQIFDYCDPDPQPDHFSLDNRNVSRNGYRNVSRKVSWSPKDFYEHVHVPDPHSSLAHETLQNPDLTCQLYPFQARAVRWLLSREKVQQELSGQITQRPPTQSLPISFKQCRDDSGRITYRSRLLLQIFSRVENIPEQFNGGILCEEMGLGKTVELISLISLHKLAGEATKVVDEFSGNEVTTCKTTLIITPPAILEQWLQELERHAPSLKVMHYKGIKQIAESDGERTLKKLMKQDVVLTTYSVLSAEMHHAVGQPERSRRREQQYNIQKSPLVMLKFWRVCLDEAQMVESGVSNAAIVARLIPRVNAWAVSGTPVRKDIMDLHGLLIFLRLFPFSDADVWQRMTIGPPSNREYLQQLFGQIAMRHSKNAVRDDFSIPPQRRLVITVPFTAIEESNYNQLHLEMCEECDLNSEGEPTNPFWNPDNSETTRKMAAWLTRLRQTCLHAEIGAQNRRALGRGHGPLRTVDEVLEVLIEQNETALHVEDRASLLSMVMQGHLFSFGAETQQALDLYLEALRRANQSVEACRRQVLDQQMKLKLGGGAGLKTEPDTMLEEDSEDEADDRRARLRQYQQRLRSALEVQHVCAFFAGTAYFQIKDKLSDGSEGSSEFQELEKKEVECYDLAKAVRKELLKDTTKKTGDLLNRLTAQRKSSFVKIPIVDSGVARGGIESRKVVDGIVTLSDILNEQVTKINEWRTKFSDLLLQKLVDEDEGVELTGEEYESSTKQQDEQYVYHEALRAAIADRHCLITGQINSLVDGEMKYALKLAKDGAPREPDSEEPINRGPAPELFQQILEERTLFLELFRVIPRFVKGNTTAEPPFISARGLMAEIRSLVTSVQWQQGMRSDRAQAEVDILENYLAKLQQITLSQTKAISALEEELNLLRDTMNQRLDFYRQLQQISDQVAPLQEEMSAEVDRDRLAAEKVKGDQHAEKLAALMTKRRFLTHLRTESSAKQEQRICIICQASFEIGVLTVCGHQYCKECIQIWWRQKQTCPLCKRHLRKNEFHEITYKPQELRAQEEVNPSSSPSRSFSSKSDTQAKSSIYTSVSQSTLEAIKSVDLPFSFSYGTKIDLICRTLLHLRTADPGSKSIIFSQYRDFLGVLSAAFRAHRIGFSAISDKAGISKFREDASVECFLLHAKADSSGLNLVNATHVFLCEPLINAAIELQAIARVHRIGQRRETTVWMFLVQDTVEEAIYEISVRRRLAHLQRTVNPADHASGADTVEAGGEAVYEENTLDAANSLEMQATPLASLMTKGQSGGEVVAREDIWNCLFGGRHKRGRGGGVDAGGNVSGAAGEEVARFLRAEAAEGRSVEEV